MRKLICLLVILAIVSCFSKAPIAAEHPGEHPGTPAKAKQAEHPGTTAEHPGAEHPGTTHEEEHPGEQEICRPCIIKAIKEHINKVTKENNGVYPLYDSKEGKDLKLKLIRVHEDKVSYIKKEDAYFACTDFITDAGVKYDVDFWMQKTSRGKLEVYQTKIHKKQGVPRFTYQDDEIVPVESGQMAPEERT